MRYFLQDNPLISRALKLTRPGVTVRRFGITMVSAAITGTIMGAVLEKQPAKFYLDELALFIGLPAFFAFGLFQFFKQRQFFESTLPVELFLTRMDPGKIVLGLYLPRTLFMATFTGVLVTLLPWFKEAFVSISVTGYVLFVIYFIALLEWVARLITFAILIFRTTIAMFLSLFLILCGVAMIHGVGGVMRKIEDDWLITPVAFLCSAGLIAVIGALTWTPFLSHVGRIYIRKVRIQLEGDEEEVDRPDEFRHGANDKF